MELSHSLHLKFRPSFFEGFLTYSEFAMNAEHFKDRSSHEVLIYAWEPIVLGQCAILYEGEDPQGFVSWGWLDREQEKRFINHRSRLRDFAHESEDDVPWILDMLAPNGRKYVSALVRLLTAEFSTWEEFAPFDCARALRPDGRLVKFNRKNNDNTRFRSTDRSSVVGLRQQTYNTV